MYLVYQTEGSLYLMKSGEEATISLRGGAWKNVRGVVVTQVF